jgi:hypothetical protein
MINWLFDASGEWSPTLMAVNRVANLLIFISYLTIPLSLFSLWLDTHKVSAVKKIVGGMPSIVICFVFCLFLSGLSHLCNVLEFDWKLHRLFTLVDVMAAISCVGTAILLPGIVKTLLREHLWGESNER